MSSKQYRQFNNLPKEQPIETIVEIKLTHDQLHEALLWIQDMLERSQISFCVIGDVGKQLVENELPTFEADKIEIAVMKRHWTQSGSSIFKDAIKQFDAKDIDITEDHASMNYHGVPVKVYIVHNYYPFFEHPDTRMYTVTEFTVPNPFNKYWEERDHIA